MPKWPRPSTDMKRNEFMSIWPLFNVFAVVGTFVDVLLLLKSLIGIFISLLANDDEEMVGSFSNKEAALGFVLPFVAWLPFTGIDDISLLLLNLFSFCGNFRAVPPFIFNSISFILLVSFEVGWQ